MRATLALRSLRFYCLAVLVFLFANTALAGASVSGAIYTTTASGTTVNGNIYDAKTDVYLNGGPQNGNDPGLVPDGAYYFQVTDPSGAVLLSSDDITCREVVVTGGRIVGVPGGSPDPACVAGAFHTLGTFDAANGEQPVQLAPFNDTPNPGGEYKAWLTPVADYNEACPPGHASYGFCDRDSKTDNFKVKKQDVAYVTVCKFNDLNGNSTQDDGEPLIPFWPITATGVDTLTGPLGTVNTQTDATGCVSFSVSTFAGDNNTDTVTLNETVLSDWLETAPLSGIYDSSAALTGSGPTAVSGFVETITVKAGDNVTAPNFGNFCVSTECGGKGLTVTKDANPSFTRTYKWNISKSVDQTQIDTSGGATFNYTVNVTHDSGTDSGWQATGTIKVSNPNPIAISGVNVADAVDNGGDCSVSGGSNIAVPANSEVDVPYACLYSALPAAGTNTATATWDDSSAQGTASVDFANAAIKIVDGSVTVTDTFGGTLGTVSYSDPSPKTFTYSHTFTDPAGTCSTHNNTATFTTDTSSTTGSASQAVKVCVGADPTVSKTAFTSYNSAISKSVDKTKVEQAGGSIAFNYTVNVITSGWTVYGNITVSNNNDWEAVTVNLADALSDPAGSCTINGGSVQTVPASSSIMPAYSCTFSAPPSASSPMNTASASWNPAIFFTPDGSASFTVGYSFASLTITDTFNSVTNTLGTVTIPPGAATFTYSRIVSNAPPGQCETFNNTAAIVQTGQTASQSVTACNTATGALTMGFWKNTNGQKIITNYCGGTSGTSLYSFLTSYNPFQDLVATTCSGDATYVAKVIGAATCSSSAGTCNAMLKAQMVATALDVYFSTPSLGGNRIGAYSGLGSSQPALGDVAIDLSNICSMADTSSGSNCTGTYEDARPEFGISTPYLGTTVSQILSYANFLSAVNGSPVSNPGGANWYNQVKNPKQVYAKDTFDNINNRVANIAPAGTTTSPSF
jgi:hypothetical protein